ncbi:MAG: T9SS type A sorting domain-containing protein [Bacteroidales bacterium]|nr:T9SS type A sorting domain-containing protein [Bacteroidales bacterium]
MKKLHYILIKRLHLSVLLALTALFFSGLSTGFSQVTVVNGTTVKINMASTLNSSENLVLNAGGTLDNQGTLILKKNLVNQNAAANSLGTGAVVFSGTVNQSISGQNVIQHLELANAAGLTVAGNTKVNGTLTLTNGLVSLGTFNLLLGPTATVAGAPAATKMVVPTSTGQLQKEFPPAGGSFTYPVGDATGVAEYSPVTLAFNSGTFGANNYAGVTLVDAQYGGTATSYLTRYWNLTQSGITGFSCNSTFQYVDADVVGTESDIFAFRVLPGPFTAYNASNTVANQINAQGLASFGTFTGNLGNAIVPPPVRSLQNKTITGGPECADATQTMLIAGNGTTYWVLAGGSVNHIAGTNILYYPGTKVLAGGYMHGYISGVFCNPYIHPGAQAPVVAGIENQGIGNPNNSFFKIYPNPTPGKFTLELNGDITSAQVHVEIFGVLGERILSKYMQIERKQEFSLTEKPTGVYVVHVTSGLNSETEKIIKR